MAMTDPIADMLTRVRNAVKAKYKSVDIPGSNLKKELARVLMDEGFIKNFKVIEDEKQGIIRLYLKYLENQGNAIFGLKRISKPSRRIYVRSKEVPKVLNGLGIAVISTSKGVMTDRQAREQNIGGEVLCNIW